MKFDLKKIKETGKEKLDKGVQFVKDHKVEITMTGVTVLSIVGLVAIGKKLFSYDTPHKTVNVPFDLESIGDSMNKKIGSHHVGIFEKQIEGKAATDIDEAIFTDLAPEIEEFCVHPGIESGFTERFFKIGDGIIKHVEVHINNLTEV